MIQLVSIFGLCLLMFFSTMLMIDPNICYKHFVRNIWYQNVSASHAKHHTFQTLLMLLHKTEKQHDCNTQHEWITAINTISNVILIKNIDVEFSFLDICEKLCVFWCERNQVIKFVIFGYNSVLIKELIIHWFEPKT